MDTKCPKVTTWVQKPISMSLHKQHSSPQPHISDPKNLGSYQKEGFILLNHTSLPILLAQSNLDWEIYPNLQGMGAYEEYQITYERYSLSVCG